MNSKYKCDYCLKSSKDPINLICEHILCFGCGSGLLKIEMENDNESKYRITCPKCKKITLTYDINNLLLSSSCSVTRGFSSENDQIRKKKCSATRRSERSEEKTKQLKKIKRKVVPTLDPNICKTHKLEFTLYCETESIAICQKCRTEHNSSHKVNDLEVALPCIIKKNIQFRAQGKDQLMDIDISISNFLKTKEQYEDSQARLTNQIINEFRIIEAILHKRKDELITELDFFFKPKIEQIDSIIADMSELRAKLKLCGRTVPQTPNKEVFIYRGFQTIKECLQKLDEEIDSLSKHSVSLEKGGSVQNIRSQIRNFLCLNLWTRKNAGKLLTPSEYYSQLKEMSKHRLSHSSSNFAEVEQHLTNTIKKQQNEKSRTSKLREYGI